MDPAHRSAIGLRQRLEKHIEDLPVLPLVLAKLMALDPNADDYFDRLVELVQSEPNFSARILAASNSAASAPRTPITTLHAAIGRLGSGTTSNLVLAISVTRVFVPRDPWEKSLWRHAVQVAIAARALALRTHDPDVPADEAYVCGLLHDVGRFVMFLEAPDLLRQIDEGDWLTPDALVSGERMICGLTHAELGAIACTKWRLPPTITNVVRDHHQPPPAAITGRDAKLTALIRFADLAMFPSAAPGTAGNAEADDEAIALLFSRLPPFVRIARSELRELVADTVRQANEVSAAIGV